MRSVLPSGGGRALASPLLLAICCILAAWRPAVVHAASPDVWRSKSIYQVIVDRFARTDLSTTAPCVLSANQYCGGTWQGLIHKLDYIQGMGFNAIWISPVVEQIDVDAAHASVGQPYHGFWSKNWYELNANFGTADDLKALSQELHNRGMLLMVDAVLNNYAYPGPDTEAPAHYSDFYPFNSAEYFHPPCYISNYDNDTDAWNCWLGKPELSLPDIDSQNPTVQAVTDQWAQELMANYSIDGFRIDAARHVDIPFWTQFQPKVNAYTVGEVLVGNATYACQYMSNALSGVLNYPLWYLINDTFLNTTADMAQLNYKFTEIAHVCQDSTLLGTFTENQDQPRMATYTDDVALLKNLVTYALLGDGIPIIYYGVEQQFKGIQDPDNRNAMWLSGYNTSMPLYPHIAAINAARNAVANASTSDYWSSYWKWKTKYVTVHTDMLAIRKGYDKSIVAVMTNRGSDAADMGPYTIGDTNFLGGDTIMDVLSCKTQKVQEYGVMTATLTKGLPQVWIPTSLMVNATNICPQVKRVNSPSFGSGAGHAATWSAPVALLSLGLSALLACSLS